MKTKKTTNPDAFATPAETTERGPVIAMTIGSDPVAQSSIQIARQGAFNGHTAGPFEMNAATFGTIIANFTATKNRRVPVDYEHATEMVSAPGVLQNGAPAVGWVTALEMRGDDLWATVEWVDDTAVSRIRAGQYAYCSPAIVFGAVDPESGEPIGARLTSVAITNRPFLDGMAPITARDPRTASLPPESVHIPAATQAERKPQPMEEEKKMATPSTAEKAMTRLRAMAAKYMTVNAEAAEDEIIDGIGAMLDKLEQVQTAEAAGMCDRVIAEGRAPASSRDRLVRLCRADRATFDALYPALPPKPATDAAPPADDAKLMSARVAPQGGTPPTRIAPAVRHGDAADDRAAKLMSERPGLSYRDAVIQASREIRDEALAPLTSILGGIQ